ncbi:hypothetical protein J2S43_001046 [Catenuloplanes nepalensis]|uniref:S-adenosyl methyltransferase n=1 Tax=Catenuloplanes nepalensis TaxID=587533 RepID=A0ABT9MM92_9ACTN|nr:SAM-dependent methyltransferase [Catenuloplanes nepalensis]MDP9792534.1 hypothetical protein [Catenuloplanes nepalensis]
MDDLPVLPEPPGGAMFPRPAFVAARLLGQDVGTPVERAAAEAAAREAPECVAVLQDTDTFRVRALHYLAIHRMRQLIVAGGGIWTSPVAADLAAQIGAGTRTVFVDDDAETTRFLTGRLDGQGTAVAVTADLTDPDEVFDHPALQGLLDLHQPVGLVLIGTLSRIAARVDTQPTLAHYILRLPPGSLLAASAWTFDGLLGADRERWRRHARVHDIGDGWSSRDVFTEDLEDVELMAPGITAARDWAPAHRAGAGPSWPPRVYAAIGRPR